MDLLEKIFRNAFRILTLILLVLIFSILIYMSLYPTVTVSNWVISSNWKIGNNWIISGHSIPNPFPVDTTVEVVEHSVEIINPDSPTFLGFALAMTILLLIISRRNNRPPDCNKKP